MARTAQEWVDAIDDAIFRIVSGGASSVSIDGQSFSMLSLPQLEEMKKYYEARAYEESGQGGFTTQADMSGGCGERY